MYPFERFTERAKKVLTMAQEEAERARHNYIGTEHLLLGLLREQDGVAAKALGNLGISLDEVRVRIEAVLGRSERILIQQIIPTSRVKKVIELSFEEATRMGHRYVGTEHLLIGILIEGEGIAAHVLNEMGATLNATQAEILRMLNSGEIPPRAPREQADTPILSLHLGRLMHGATSQADRQEEGVTGLEHLLRALMDDEAGFEELGALLDRQGVPWRPPEELKALARQIHQVASRRAEATARQDQQSAAELRNEENRLRAEHRRVEMAWIASMKPDQPQP